MCGVGELTVIGLISSDTVWTTSQSFICKAQLGFCNDNNDDGGIRSNEIYANCE